MIKVPLKNDKNNPWRKLTLKERGTTNKTGARSKTGRGMCSGVASLGVSWYS